MHQLLLDSIFRNSKEEYASIESETLRFLTQHAGDRMIIQDDIFSIIKNYDSKINYLFYPIKDTEICGFICNYKGHIFLYVNTFLPLEKQIFTAAHELYHLIYNKDQIEYDFKHLITEEDLEKKEERKANLFAALTLVPTSALDNQIRVLKIDKNKIELLDIIKLMNIFAVPYKTIVLRLYEAGYINERKADEFLNIPDRDENQGVLYLINKYGIGKRWQKRTLDIQYGDLKALIIDNDEENLIPEVKTKKDFEYIQKDIWEIYRELGDKFDDLGFTVFYT